MSDGSLSKAQDYYVREHCEWVEWVDCVQSDVRVCSLASHRGRDLAKTKVLEGRMRLEMNTARGARGDGGFNLIAAWRKEEDAAG